MIILILLLFWMLLRRNRSNKEKDYQFSTQENTHSSESNYLEDDDVIIVSEPAEEDPITQADIFIAYGNVPAAIDVMETAVNNAPNNSAYQQKLSELQARLNVTSDEIESVSKDLASSNNDADSELAQASHQQPDEDIISDDDMLAFNQDITEQVTSTDILADNELELDISESLAELEQESPRSSAAEYTLEDPSDNNEFSLDHLSEDLIALSENSNTELEEISLDIDEDSTEDFDISELDNILDNENIESPLSLLDENESTNETNEALVIDEENSSLAADAEADLTEGEDEMPIDDGLIDIDDHQQDLLNEVDEIGTKLDLARAYIDMGDPAGAKDILEEVLNEGNDDQVEVAKELITQIA
ncbi:MAG: hypothetical protein HUJ30_06850 [Gammaproteobacteria bacterium]|nr:hypothetical protein [Gammaproteobacteria bacterium]